MGTWRTEILRQAINFCQIVCASLKEGLYSAMLAVADLGIQVLLAVAKTQQMPLINVESNNLLEELV
jgi:hypothetical protein